MTVALACKNVTKWYESRCVVENVSLTAQEGQLVTLLGPSGCGKTTTLRLIAGFERPDNGEITLKGRVVAGGDFVPAEKRRVGMVFQDYALFPHLSVAENVAFGLDMRDKVARKRRIEEMLALVGLESYANQMPYALSGGQQQRVALARALAPQPQILLLDEPFSNLDTALRQQVRGEVRQILRATATTAIFVTHDQEEALSLSDKIAVMFNGKLHQIGTPEQLYNTPSDLSVASFIGEANFLPASANGTWAQSALGAVKLLQPAQGAVKLLVRPERLHIDFQGEGVLAEVQWREYYGRDQRIGIKLHDNTPLVVSTDTQVSYNKGDRVRVSLFAPLLAF